MLSSLFAAAWPIAVPFAVLVAGGLLFGRTTGRCRSCGSKISAQAELCDWCADNPRAAP